MACFLSIRANVIIGSLFHKNIRKIMAANSGYPKAPLFHGVRCGPHLTGFVLNFDCNRSCFIYVVYSKTSCLCNFPDDEWLWNPEISMLFMLAFYQLLTTEVECLPLCEDWKNEVSHIAGWHTCRACRLHNLPNQIVKENNYWSTAFVFPFTVFKWKEKWRL